MFKNYYLFQQQTREIKSQINGSIINSVYTVHKNELIFDLRKDDNFFQLAISITPSRPYILLTKQTHYKSAHYDKFEMLYGLDIYSFEIVTNNKFVKIELNNYYINAFFYSNFPNIIVYDSKGQLLDSFKSIKTEKPVKEPNENIIQKGDDDIKKYILSVKGISVKELIKLVFPALNNQMLSELYNRFNSTANNSIDTIDKQEFSDKLITFSKEIASGKAYIYRQNDFTKYLLLYKSGLYTDPEYQIEEFESINKAWNIFTRENQKHNDFEKLINPILKAIKKRKHVLETTLFQAC